MNKYITKLALNIAEPLEGLGAKLVGGHDASMEGVKRLGSSIPIKTKVSPSVTGQRRRLTAGLGLAGATALGTYFAASGNKDNNQEKQATMIQPEDQNQHKKDLLNTATMGAIGAGTGALTNQIVHGGKAALDGAKKMKSSNAKAALIGGGLGLVGDYAGVKLNNAMNKYLDKAAAIALNPANKGLLHKKMGVPEGKKLSTSELESEKNSAKKSGNVKLEREAQFAINAKKWHHKG